MLGLLFGTMVVGGYLKGDGMLKHLGKLLAWRSQGGRDLLCCVCVVTALASALFTNDTCCGVLTEFVLELAAERNLPAKPFLLAFTTSANTVKKLLTDGQVHASKFLMLSGKIKSLSMYCLLILSFLLCVAVNAGR